MVLRKMGAKNSCHFLLGDYQITGRVAGRVVACPTIYLTQVLNTQHRQDFNSPFSSLAPLIQTEDRKYNKSFFLLLTRITSYSSSPCFLARSLHPPATFFVVDLLVMLRLLVPETTVFALRRPYYLHSGGAQVATGFSAWGGNTVHRVSKSSYFTK